MLSADYFVEKIDEASRVNRDAKQVCNDALSLARGKIQKLQNDIKVKDARIAELEAEVMEYRVDTIDRRLKDLEKSHEDQWIPCSEGLPNRYDDVLIQIKDCDEPGNDLTPRTGYIGASNRWLVYLEPNRSDWLSSNYKVIAWQPLPEKYEEPVVEDEPEEVKFEIGDFVLCVSKAGVKINAVYLREDEEHYWILDKNCLTQQPLDKNHWKLTKYPGHMSVVEWLTKL